MKIESIAQVAALSLIILGVLVVSFVTIAPMFGLTPTPFAQDTARTLLGFLIGLATGGGVTLGYTGLRMLQANEMLVKSLTKG